MVPPGPKARSAPVLTAWVQACEPSEARAVTALAVPIATERAPVGPASNTGAPVAGPGSCRFQRQSESDALPAAEAAFPVASAAEAASCAVTVPAASGAEMAAAPKSTRALKWCVRFPFAQGDALAGGTSTACTAWPPAVSAGGETTPAPQSVTSKVTSAASSRNRRVLPCRPQERPLAQASAGAALA